MGNWGVQTGALIVSGAQGLLSIVFILVIGTLALRIAHAAVNRLLANRLVEDRARENRVKTLANVGRSVVSYLGFFVMGMMILEQLSIQTSSLIAAAGIGGLAIGFGAQNLVRDLVSGFFILLEDQYDVGDFISTGGTSGLVEEIGIRVTKIRDFGGELHIVPNGTVERVTNHMGNAMRVLVDVDIAYEEDVQNAMDVLDELFVQLAEELEDVVEGPKVLGVQELGASGVKLLTLAKAKPMTQWSMSREIRKRIKQAFDEKGIEIPYPRRYLVFDKHSFHKELMDNEANTQ